MVLNFGGSNLFPSQSLLNEDGLLKERCMQDGSEIVSVIGGYGNGGAFAWQSIYTITAGKVFYVTTITYYGSVISTYFSDSDEVSKVVLIAQEPDEVIIFQPATPLKFTTEVNCGSDHSTLQISLSGWEEKA